MQNNTKYDITPEEFSNMSSEEKILKVAGGLVPPPGRPQDEVLGSILDKIEAETPTKIYRLKRYLQAVAAILILAVAIKVLPSILSAQQCKTAYAETSELVLPDGTEVVLNAGSKIKWDKKKFNNKRYLSLNGEAYFNVKKGEEFIIKTKNGTVEILGTQLNVYSRQKDFWVSCISGKVRVFTGGEQEIITPGEWVRLNDMELEKSKSEAIENTVSWKDGILHFEDTKLETIFAELERQFDVRIKFEGDVRRRATVDFPNENLDEALNIVCIPMGLDYDIKNRKINISEKR